MNEIEFARHFAEAQISIGLVTGTGANGVEILADGGGNGLMRSLDLDHDPQPDDSVLIWSFPNSQMATILGPSPWRSAGSMTGMLPDAGIPTHHPAMSRGELVTAVARGAQSPWIERGVIVDILPGDLYAVAVPGRQAILCRNIATAQLSVGSTVYAACAHGSWQLAFIFELAGNSTGTTAPISTGPGQGKTLLYWPCEGGDYFARGNCVGLGSGYPMGVIPSGPTTVGGQEPTYPADDVGWNTSGTAIPPGLTPPPFIGPVDFHDGNTMICAWRGLIICNVDVPAMTYAPATVPGHPTAIYLPGSNVTIALANVLGLVPGMTVTVDAETNCIISAVNKSAKTITIVSLAQSHTNPVVSTVAGWMIAAVSTAPRVVSKGVPLASPQATCSAKTNPTQLVVSSTTGIQVGQYVVCLVPGVLSANTTVTAISGSTVTLSNSVLATQTSAVTFEFFADPGQQSFVAGDVVWGIAPNYALTHAAIDTNTGILYGYDQGHAQMVAIDVSSDTLPAAGTRLKWNQVYGTASTSTIWKDFMVTPGSGSLVAVGTIVGTGEPVLSYINMATGGVLHSHTFSGRTLPLRKNMGQSVFWYSGGWAVIQTNKQNAPTTISGIPCWGLISSTFFPGPGPMTPRTFSTYTLGSPASTTITSFSAYISAVKPDGSLQYDLPVTVHAVNGVEGDELPSSPSVGVVSTFQGGTPYGSGFEFVYPLLPIPTSGWSGDANNAITSFTWGDTNFSSVTIPSSDVPSGPAAYPGTTTSPCTTVQGGDLMCTSIIRSGLAFYSQAMVAGSEDPVTHIFSGQYINSVDVFGNSQPLSFSFGRDVRVFINMFDGSVSSMSDIYVCPTHLLPGGVPQTVVDKRETIICRTSQIQGWMIAARLESFSFAPHNWTRTFRCYDSGGNLKWTQQYTSSVAADETIAAVAYGIDNDLTGTVAVANMISYSFSLNKMNVFSATIGEILPLIVTYTPALNTMTPAAPAFGFPKGLSYPVRLDMPVMTGDGYIYYAAGGNNEVFPISPLVICRIKNANAP